MTTLHERLSRLADQADPAADAAPPPELWQRGRRYGRRRAASTAASVLVVALVVAVSAAGLASRATRPVEPTAPQGQTSLPDRFFVPDGRLPVAHGGTGPLVAVIPAEHFAWTSNGRPGLVGVSAVDQQYAFLDLPGWLGETVPGASWSLSPNGRWLAYWYGDRAEVAGELPADGIAVLDTSTGEVRRHELVSGLGVEAHRVAWSGNTLWFTEWDYTALDESGGSAASSLVASYAWELGSPAPHEVQDPHLLIADPAGPAGVDGFLGHAGKDRWYAVHSETDLAGQPVARFRDPGQYQPDAVTLSPDGRTVAMVQSEDSGNTARVLTGSVAGDDVQLQALDADLGKYPSLLGWLDDHSVAVVTYREGAQRLVAVDVGTGQTRTLSTFDQTYNNGTQLASDLLRSPVVDAKQPPHPVDPRKVAAGVALGVVVLLWLGLGVRRRRARR